MQRQQQGVVDSDFRVDEWKMRLKARRAKERQVQEEEGQQRFR